MTAKRPCARVRIDSFMSSGAVQRAWKVWVLEPPLQVVLPGDEEKNEQNTKDE